jgi:hypothetical protein
MLNAGDEEVPFPVNQQRRDKIRAVAGEIALIRSQHLIRKHFKGDLMELQATLRSVADLVLDVERHEALADIDEDEHIRRIEAMRADIAKGNRIADANERFFEESAAAQAQAQERPAKNKDTRP